MNTREQVIDIIVNKLGVERETVVDSASFTNDLGADSLDTVELIMEFEREFEMEIFKTENLTFTYSGNNQPTIKDISVTINKGDFVTVFGATGSGKSTILNLIPRLQDRYFHPEMIVKIFNKL